MPYPYLVLAKILTGAHHGTPNCLDPGDASVGNAGNGRDPNLAFSWQRALGALSAGRILKGVSRRSVSATFLCYKEVRTGSFLSPDEPT